MRAIPYYLLLPVIYLTSLSPAWILYRISDFLFVIVYYLVGYRKKVVYTNLQNAFPDKTASEINQIAKNYYSYLCDILVETIKTITMSERYVHKHMTFNDVDKMNALYDQNQSVILIMGHFGNWELAGPCFSLNCKHQLKVVYQVLSNPYFEQLMSKARTKFSTRIVPRQQMLRSMVRDKAAIDATAIISDQAPSDRKAGTWLTFLNQQTLVHTGAEKVSKMFNYPVVYIHIERIKRGFYEITPTILNETPSASNEFDVTKAFFAKLEKEIHKKPETWLWSHRRWKHKFSNT